MLDVHGKRVVIAGLGRTAVALARLVQRMGGEPFVSDCVDTPALAPHRAALEAANIPYEVGGHSHRIFRTCDIVVPSPGVSPRIAPILTAVAAGATLSCEFDLAFPHCRSTIIAVTGTNGKTTTTEWLRAMVAACGHPVGLAGNNDHPFSEAVLDDPAPEWLVLEASSYALEGIQHFRPRLGAVLNLTPDHLARHGTMRAYAAAKRRLFAHCNAQDTAVLNQDDPAVYAMRAGLRAHLRTFSLDHRVDAGLYLQNSDIREGGRTVASAAEIPLPGRHNVANALAALTMLRADGFNWDKVLEGMRGFRGVEHRIEFVGEFGGIRIYNDSKSTNIDSLRVALESFEEPLVLIAGGQGKGAEYGVLQPLIAQRVDHLVVFGDDAPLFAAAFSSVTSVERAATLEEAVCKALEAAAPDRVLLFSPACASFDMFTNFEERGRAFKAIARRLASGETACNAKP